MPVDDWFLSATERGNHGTAIDRRRPDGTAWTGGNRVELLVDGRTYFARLHHELCALRRGDAVFFTDWQGDPDEQLAGQGAEVAPVLAELAQRGVHVRGLLWRSHPRQAHFAEQQNTALTKIVNDAGGEVMLDQRVKRGGSHHQKLVILHHDHDPDNDVAFVGGIDLCHGRNDDSGHAGDPQAIALDARYGQRPPWHDVQLEVRGPAVGDLAHTFRERWDDPTPLDHHNPVRMLLRSLTGQPRRPEPLPTAPHDPAPCGPHTVQVLRTYPAKRPRFPFAPRGERSIARAYLKAFPRARSLIYIEDQYFWSRRAARGLAEALKSNPALHLIVVVPRYPERTGPLTGPASRLAREQAVDLIMNAGGERVAIYDLENAASRPIYVHAKACIIDDVWMIVGSDNLNRRSWTHDSELSCAVLDSTTDGRDPSDPAQLGDHARRLARDVRLRLWREHLERADGDDDDLIDPVQAIGALRDAAAALEAWHRGGRLGARPRGRLRPHTPEHVRAIQRWWAHPLKQVVLDPDGRPWTMRLRDTH